MRPQMQRNQHKHRVAQAPIGQGHSKKNLRFERRSKIHKSVRQSWRDDSFFGCTAKVALSSVPLLGNSRKTPLIWHLGRIFIVVFALFFLFLHKIISTAGSDLVFFVTKESPPPPLSLFLDSGQKGRRRLQSP